MANDFSLGIGVVAQVDEKKIQAQINGKAKNLKMDAEVNANFEKVYKDAQKQLKSLYDLKKQYARIESPTKDEVYYYDQAIKKAQELYRIAKASTSEKDVYDFQKRNELELKSIQYERQLNDIISKQTKSTLQERLAAENKFQAELKQTAKVQSNATSLKLDKITFDNNISSYLKNNTKLSTELKNKLIEVQMQISSVDKEGLNNLKKEFRSITSEAEMLGKTGDNAFTRLRKNAGQFLNYLGSATVIMGTINSVRTLIDNVYEIDTAMTSLKKVTSEVDSVYSNFLDNAAIKAQSLGMSVSSLITQTAEWAKLGYGVEDASKLAETSSIYANVGEVDDATAVADLVSTMKAFNIEASNSIKIVDSLNNLENKYAVSASGLGEGLKNSASAMALAGNDMYKTLALLTGGGEITQNVGELGNMLKVASLRLSSMKGELEEIGEEYEDIISVNKNQTAIYNLTKGQVNILDEQNNKLKSTYDILKEVAGAWDDVAELDKSTLLELMFGKQRANQGAAILSAFQSGQIDKALNDAINSDNSAINEQEKWLASLQAKVQQFQASIEGLSEELVSSDFLKIMVDSGSNAINVLTDIIDKLGLFPTLLTSISTGLSFKNVGIFSTTDTGEITNIFSQLSNSSKLAKTSVDEVNNAITHYNTNIRTSAVEVDALNKVQASDTMTSYLQSLKGGEATLQGYNASLKTATVSSIGLKFATIALNTALTFGASILISSLFKAWDDYSNKITNAINKSDELKKSFASSTTSINDNLSSAKSLSDEYDTLSQGVDKYGKNISLTTDEYSRYKEILDKIVELNPSVVNGYDSESNAIIDKNTALKETIELLEKERQLELEKALSTDSLTTLGLGAFAKRQQLEGSDYTSQFGEPDLKTVSGQATRFGQEAAKLFNEKTIKAFYEYTKARPSKKMYGSNPLQFLGLEESDLDLEAYLSSNIGTFAKNMDAIIESAKIPEDEVNNLKSFVDEWITLNTELSTIDSSYIDEYMQQIPKLVDGYDSLTDANKNFISEYIRNGFSSLDLQNDAVGVKTEIVSLISDISNNRELQDAITNLFSIDSSKISTSDYITQVNDLINQIAEILNVDSLSLKVKLGIDTESEEALLQEVKNKFSTTGEKGMAGISLALNVPDKKEIDAWISSLPVDDLKILAKLDIDQNATKESIEQSLEVAKQVAQDPANTIKSTFDEAFNADSFSGARDTLIELAKAGELSEETFTSNDKFQQLLTDTGTTADEAIKKIKELSEGVMGLSDWQNQLSSARDSISQLKTILKEVDKDGLSKISSSSIDTIISKYPQLLGLMNDEKALREGIADAISEQETLADQAYMNMVANSDIYYENLKNKENAKLQLANSVINGIIQGNNTLVSSLGSAYKVDLNNFKNIAEAKAALEEQLIKNSAKAWSEYYKVQVNASTGLASVTSVNKVRTPSSGGGNDEYAESGKAANVANAAASAYNAAISQLQSIVSNTNITTSNVKGSGGGSKTKEAFSKVFDWMAIRIDKLQEKAQTAIDNVAKYFSYANKNKQLTIAIKADVDEKKSLQSIQKKYEKLASKVGLSKKYRDLVDNGGLNVQTIKDEKLAKKIEEYQKWRDAAKEVGDKISDITAEIEELNRQKLDNIKSYFDVKESNTNSNISNRDATIALNQAKGGTASKGDYDYIIKQNQQQKKDAQAEYNAYKAELDKQLKSGAYTKDSVKYKEQLAYLTELKTQMTGYDAAIIEAKNDIQELANQKFDNSISQIDDNMTEIDQLLKLTKEGSNEEVLLLTEGFDQAKKKSADLKVEIAKLNAQYANDKGNTIYLERLKELRSELYSAVDAMQSYNDALVQSIKVRYDDQIDSLEKERDAYEDLINAQKKALQQEKENHDYQKSISEKNESISDVQARIKELEKAAKTGDRNAMKEKADLEEELADLKDDLAETQYDREIELQEDALDNALDAYNKEIDARKTAIESLFAKEEELIINAAKLSESQFKAALDNIKAYAEQNNLSISDSLSSAFNGDDVKANSKSSQIKSILESASGTGKGSSELNEHVKELGYNQLSYSQMAQLAGVLGISGVTPENIVSDTATKKKIKQALIDAGFKKGGTVDASSIKSGALADLVKSVGEDGIALVKHGDEFFTDEKAKLVRGLIGNIEPIKNLVQMSTPNLSNISTNSAPVFNFENMIQLNGTLTGKDAATQVQNAGNDIIQQLAAHMRQK
jgi:TP901 family phage tail tape measure protein